MTIEKELKKEGINVIKRINTLTVNSIAKSVAEKLVLAFPEQNLNYNELFIKLSRLDMYIADLPLASGAKYYYKNSSIYFSKNIDFENIDAYAIHECIHALQEYRDDKNNLIRLGLCDFTSFNLDGMALNEAAVQLLSSTSLHKPTDIVKYFDITLPTNTPTHYTLECNLLKQMAYITGIDVLYNSTLYSNDNFANRFIELTSKKIFLNIRRNLDKLLALEDTLSIESQKLENIDDSDKKIAIITSNISNLRNEIKALFLKIQNTILTSYFDSSFNKLSTLKELDSYRQKLYNYKDLIGTVDNYTYFNDYYINKMSDLELKHNFIENCEYNSNSDMAIMPIHTNFLSVLFSKIRKVFIHNSNLENVYIKEK